MSVAPISRRRGGADGGDEGSALLMVLVFITLVSLISLPLLNFSVTLARQNNVLSDKTSRQEAVKAGLRTALSNPPAIYSYCFDGGTQLAGPGIAGIDVETQCHLIDSVVGLDDQDIHLGVVATRVGETVPDSLATIYKKDEFGNPVLDAGGNPIRLVYAPSTDDPQEWLDAGAPYAPTVESSPQQIWAPNLPVHSVSLRGSQGFDMPAGFPTCKVYFPGTYRDPVEITGPTYFASGIYNFQNTVTIGKDADVVGGMGQHPGCTTDQEAVFYATNAPAVHTISGLGVTFIFSSDASRNSDGRLIVTNEQGPTSIRLNQRYVADEDEGGMPSYGVSIASVNGKLVGGPNAAGEYDLAALDVAGVNYVPASMVGLDGGATPPVSAGKHKLQPSRLTHEPRPPSPPRWDAAQPLVALRTGTGTNDGAVRVRWQEPESLGGLAVDEYVVTASPDGATCVPSGLPLECVVRGLTSGTAYTFKVTARNAAGTSVASADSASVTPRTSGGSASPMAGSPATPAAPSAVRHPDDTVVVTWTAPADNNVPITDYVVGAEPALDSVAQPCVPLTATSCMIRNLPVLYPGDPTGTGDPSADYVFRVSATNELGSSAASAASATSSLVPASTGPSPADPAPVEPLVVAPYEPTPIVNIDLPAEHRAIVDIPGYISVPQGVLRVENPHGLGAADDDSTVAVTGGILAAAFRINDTRVALDGTLQAPIGIVNPVVQRVFRITSTTTSGSPTVTSTAIVQINQNGAYAVNSWVVQ